MEPCELADRHAEALRSKYPNVPTYAIPKKRFSDSSTNELTKSIIELIRQHGGFATRVNAGGIYDEKLKIFRQSHTAAGTPDVIASCFGKFIGVEIKYGKDKLSDSQIKVGKQIQSGGGYYVVAKNFKDFSNWLLQIKQGAQS